MNQDVSIKTFLWAIVVGMGLKVGVGLITLLIDLAAKAVQR